MIRTGTSSHLSAFTSKSARTFLFPLFSHRELLGANQDKINEVLENQMSKTY